MWPENIPAPLVRNAGRPTDSAGLSSRFSRRSDITETMQIPAPIASSGRLTGVPWKLAPVRTVSLSGRKIGLSTTPFSSISTCCRVHATRSRNEPTTCGVERIEYASCTFTLSLPVTRSEPA